MNERPQFSPLFGGDADTWVRGKYLRRAKLRLFL